MCFVCGCCCCVLVCVCIVCVLVGGATTRVSDVPRTANCRAGGRELHPGGGCGRGKGSDGAVIREPEHTERSCLEAVFIFFRAV